MVEVEGEFAPMLAVRLHQNWQVARRSAWYGERGEACAAPAPLRGSGGSAPAA